MQGHFRQAGSARSRVLWGLLGFLVACGGVLPEEPQATPAAVEQAHSDSCPRGQVRWLRRSTGPGNERVVGMALDREGNSIIAGGYQGTADFGAGPMPASSEAGGSALFVTKYAPDGALRWSLKIAPAPMSEEGGLALLGLTADRWGNITFAVLSMQPLRIGKTWLPVGLFLAQLSPAGHLRWHRPLGNAFPSYGMTLSSDDDGHVLFAGGMDGVLDFGGGARSGFEAAFVARYTRDGAYLWDRVFSTADDSLFSAVTADSKNNVYVVGFFNGTLRFGEEVVTSHFNDSLLVKFSPSGEVLWARTYDTLGTFMDVAVHGNRVLVGGDYSRAFTFGGKTIPGDERGAGLLLAYTREGEERWARSVGERVSQLAVDHEDNVTVTGLARTGDDLGTGPLPGSPDESFSFIARYGRVDGTPRWVLPRRAAGGYLEVSREGDIFLGGTFEDVPVDLGTGVLVPEGFSDTFMLRLCD
ncbi:hypothetical protein NR798_13035 [Archangium gephyra]|uniref:hypothetical protein n=1 Tax=Archangium gephyra TaxID=48 RepID=UPI0035D427EC